MQFPNMCTPPHIHNMKAIYEFFLMFQLKRYELLPYTYTVHVHIFTQNNLDHSILHTYVHEQYTFLRFFFGGGVYVFGADKKPRRKVFSDRA